MARSKGVNGSWRDLYFGILVLVEVLLTHIFFGRFQQDMTDANLYVRVLTVYVCVQVAGLLLSYKQL